ncbi:MAG: hypothetical protein ISS25_00135 [Nanoarchaeota archaeon]|nr:hypothetical protein [DPANN group archaeon]MBL7116227.1 hypothetical protein [Nanoarchaeota archaeon]
MTWKRLLPLIPFFSIFLVKKAEAHCPLCTIGAGAAAGGAALLGVNQGVIGVFIGGFAVSMGWWVARLIKKQFIPFQKWALILLSFVLTIFPILPIMSDVHATYISIMGDYGSLLNRTYLLNIFLIGSIIGGIIVSSTPWLSSKITKLRKGKMVPYQGIILTLLLLIITGGIIQLVI